MFPSRAEWFEHEMQAHRKSWYCLFCDRESKTSEQLLRHMQKQHGETIMEAQIATVLKSCERPVQGISSTACPFCDDWKVSSDVVQPSTEIRVTPAQFRRHLGKHLEQISLFALPRRHVDDNNDNEGDQDSNRALDNTSDSISHQTEEAEDVEEIEEIEEIIDLDQLRLLEVQRRIERIRTRKRPSLIDTVSSADSRLLNQLQLLWEQALMGRTTRHGPDHPHTIQLIEDLAVLYQVLEKWDILVRLRSDALRRVSKEENTSVSQVTMDYDRATAFVLLMKAYRDQGAVIALDNLRMNLMRQTHVSQSYPTICNTAYVLVEHGFFSEARELCTRANEMMRLSDYPPELCVLAQLLARAGMDDEAALLAYRILRILQKSTNGMIDKEIKVELSALARTFIRKGKSELGRLLRLAAIGLSTEGSEEPFVLPSHENEAAASILITSTTVTSKPPDAQQGRDVQAHSTAEVEYGSIVTSSYSEHINDSNFAEPETKDPSLQDHVGMDISDGEILAYVKEVVQKVNNGNDVIPIDVDLLSNGMDSLQVFEIIQGIHEKNVLPPESTLPFIDVINSKTIKGPVTPRPPFTTVI